MEICPKPPENPVSIIKVANTLYELIKHLSLEIIEPESLDIL
jgi:hypothetical protein